MAKCGQHHPTIVQNWANSANVGRNLPHVGQICPTSTRIQGKSTNFGRIWLGSRSNLSTTWGPASTEKNTLLQSRSWFEQAEFWRWAPNSCRRHDLTPPRRPCPAICRTSASLQDRRPLHRRSAKKSWMSESCPPFRVCHCRTPPEPRRPSGMPRMQPGAKPRRPPSVKTCQGCMGNSIVNST